MTDLTEYEPLHGKAVLSPKISTSTGDATLALPKYALEMGIEEWVKTYPDEQYPGINHIELYSTEYGYSLKEAIEAAIRYKEYPPFRFLLSKVGRLAIVTAQVGYDKESLGRVIVPPPDFIFEKDESPVDSVDLESHPQTIAQKALKEIHIGRAGVAGADINVDLPQAEADAIFRFMMSGAQETR